MEMDSKEVGFIIVFSQEGSSPQEEGSRSRYKLLSTNSVNHSMVYVCQDFPEWSAGRLDYITA